MKKNTRTIVEPTDDEVAKLAYSLFEESGWQDGHDVEHWLQAKAHLCTDRRHTNFSDKQALEHHESSRA